MGNETEAVQTSGLVAEVKAEDVKPELMYNLKLSEGSVNQILGVLGKQPYTEVSETISTIFQNTKLIEESKQESPVEGA
tara:strand:- start:2197 stop:2433 length:237 start_codon:yes stop_codon:yes gene_type:complete